VTEGRIVLEARGVEKRFGRVHALRGADFDVREREIVALVGDNGAGKSTLVKVLTGVHAPDGGELRFDGDVVEMARPNSARNLGIETVYQDLALAPELDSTANLFLGRETRRPGVLGRLGFMDQRRMREQTQEICRSLGVNLQDRGVPVARLSGGQRQGVAVSRAVAWANKVVFLDEPTAALGVVQTAKVLELIARVKERGVSVVLISHSMPEVLEISDRIQVLRLGRRVASLQTSETTMQEVVMAMTSGALEGEAA
jgi:simple sugar transport system ATP-binding protein